ncbi:MAG: DEAD/DEAH box helicase [Fimbriimonadaceae bacterium]|nr:DEAD/DEAH box helicase [Fimbriimonadaceae bacterium]
MPPNQMTDYQAKYLSCLLTQRHPTDSTEKLAGALVDAQVDLNPHQVEAALFAFRSPFSKGALLADEVGLGKTIEAGLVISQRWAERKRRILIITPSNLRKQWHQELQEKFFLPCTILESKPYNEAVKKGNFSPFDMKDSIVICSYQFARNKATDVNRIAWDLVVIDEAHRLRNVYKPSNVIANTIKAALQPSPKLLLTATPLQNSLLELFGLVSIIDDHAFGDFKSFREQYSRLDNESVYDVLKARLNPICHRTLRRQVSQYVSYTQRFPMVESFTPERSETQLYDDVSEYLRRENLLALPSSQRALMTLVLRKLLASSTFAIAGALDTVINRLEKKLKRQSPGTSLTDELDEDFEALDEIADEWEGIADDEEPLTEDQILALALEVEDLRRFRDLAVSIRNNAKGKALLVALKRAFAEAERLGAAHKAIIFTESRKTQDYLQRLLEQSDYADGIVMFNGSNTDDRSKRIYADWVQTNQGTDKITGSRTADMRSALVDYFRDQGKIMIATEAGAEGINLQFCSLVVNYDLPWNPQRIEQRIGRCHRYGQKHDVVVVNFVNLENEADQRVFELLSEKFKLFEGVFGASDEVLGAIESGVDFERRIGEIYQQCRTTDDIKESFDKLQLDLDDEIRMQMATTRSQLMENFDEEVHEKLKVSMTESQEALSRYEQMLMRVTRHELRDVAEFGDGGMSFRLTQNPTPDSVGVPLGLYELPRRTGDAHLYRMGHPLAEFVLDRAQARDLPLAEVVFDYTGTATKISILEPFVGRGGELVATLVTIESLDRAEDHLILSAVSDDGTELDEEIVRRMLGLNARLGDSVLDLLNRTKLADMTQRRLAEITANLSERNTVFFVQEANKLDSWADDLKVGLEKEIKELDRQVKEAKRAATMTGSLEEKLNAMRVVKKLEAERNAKRRSLFEAQDEIERKRDVLLEETQAKLEQKTTVKALFAIWWRLI